MKTIISLSTFLFSCAFTILSPHTKSYRAVESFLKAHEEVFQYQEVCRDFIDCVLTKRIEKLDLMIESNCWFDYHAFVADDYTYSSPLGAQVSTFFNEKVFKPYISWINQSLIAAGAGEDEGDFVPVKEESVDTDYITIDVEDGVCDRWAKMIPLCEYEKWYHLIAKAYLEKSLEAASIKKEEKRKSHCVVA